MLTSGLHSVCVDTGTPTPRPLLSKLKLCTEMNQCVTVAVTKHYRLKQQQCERKKRERCGLPKDSFRCLQMASSLSTTRLFPSVSVSKVSLYVRISEILDSSWP